MEEEVSLTDWFSRMTIHPSWRSIQVEESYTGPRLLENESPTTGWYHFADLGFYSLWNILPNKKSCTSDTSCN